MPATRPKIDPDDALPPIAASIAANAMRACGEARAVVRDHPDHRGARRVLAAALRAVGNDREAEQHELRAIEIGLQHPAVKQAEQAIADERLEDAEKLIRPYLRANPDDAGAAHMLGSIAERCGALREAENLYRRALLLAPAYAESAISLAKLFNKEGRVDDSLATVDSVLAREPAHALALALKAGMLVQYRRLDAADTVFRALVRHHPGDGRGWMNYAHLLKTTGRIDEAIAAYRASVTATPERGIAWWGLANLKSVRLDAGDVAAMTAALATASDDDDRLHLHFALAKALGDLGEHAAAMEQLGHGSALRLARTPHDADRVHANVTKVKATITPAFLADHAGQGHPARDPIFIVSMPRSGSTLVEQILASHPLVEGTEELYDIERIALDLAPSEGAETYLDKLGDLPPDRLRALGEHYIAATRRHRFTDRPLFTDKMPSNWVYAGFIHLILPNAKIIDVRRHPMACGFANYAQHYNWGINFSYDLGDIGRFYSDYVEQMAHIDRVAPGLVHRVHHEALVDDLEGEVRRMLDHLGLPFDPACLRFHETERAVHTPSSEQVRRPVNRDGMERWRDYDPWLGPLRDVLGDVLTAYPEVPERFR